MNKSDITSVSALGWHDVKGQSEIVVGKWQKHGIALPPDQPWEKGKLLKAFPSTVIEDNDRTVLYYYVYSLENASDYNLAIAERGNGNSGAWEKHLLSRHGRDYFSMEGLPENWYPIQPNIIRLAPDFWRMYFWVHGKGICRFLAAESRNGLNWRVLNADNPCLYHVGNDHAAKDGMAPPELCANDATTVYMLSDGTFEMYSAAVIFTTPDHPAYIGHDISPGAVRFVQRWTSRNGLNWNNPEVVLAPDAKDPVDLQIYYLSVAQMKNYRLGFAGHYTAQNQVQGMELLLSYDGAHWLRPARGNCFPMTDKYDCYGVYAPHTFLTKDDNILMYYSGTNATHNKTQCSGGRPENTIAAASINKKKIFGRQTCSGTVMSPPVRMMNAECTLYLEGGAQLSWCDVLGRIITDCEPVEVAPEKDSERCIIPIPEKLKHQPICLRISGNFTLFDLEC